MVFARRTLLKWMSAAATGILGEILSPSGLISIPASAFIMPPKSFPLAQYDCLLNAEMLKLDDREFHEAFVVPGCKQIADGFFKAAERLRFLDSSEVMLRENQRKIVFPRGPVYILERIFTPVYGHKASLFAMVKESAGLPD